MVDLINGKYGKVKGKINKELKELVKTNYPSKRDKDLLTVTEHKKNFKQKCIDYELDDLYKNEKHLLNYILFPEVSIDYYCELKRSSEDFMIDLQQGLGIIID
jgi:pyruvate/oxaloacetate carboxyltransferase